VDVCHAWDYTKGAGITVAVVDDGIDTRHQDLINNVVPGYDAVPYGTWCGWTCAPVYLTDPGCASNLSNHGTQCAGIIGAEQNNSIGISGISPEVNIMPVRIYYFNAIFGAYETNAAWEAAGLAFAWQNADVLSNSWSYPPPGYSAATDVELNNALAFGRGGMGCVVVFSTGNADASAINWPSSKPGMIAVGAMSMCEERKNPASCDGETWWGSNYGYGPGGIPGTMGDFLSVVAPGVGVQTTHPWTNVYNAGFNGTSAACPHVSGAAALILAANPCMTTTEVKNLIEQTADKINTSVYAYATAQPNGAWDPEVGYGRVNIGQAVTFAYNMYRQDETESSAVKVYESSHHLYAGENVTALKSAGKYTINGTANITFMAANAITLDEGFMADAGSSVFLADLGTPCSVTSQHYKPTPQAEKTLASYKKAARGIAGIRLHPNPNAGSFEMEIPAEGSYELRLLNMLGSVVYEATLQGSRKHAIELDNSLPAGNYTLQVTGKDVRHVEKVVIAK
jgi:subtilisin family serine protease